MQSLEKRIAQLEQRQHRVPIPCAFDSVEAAQAAGVRGGWLHIGETMGASEWVAPPQRRNRLHCAR